MGAELRRTSLTLLTLASIIVCSGCATARNPRDPLEPLNRSIYKFNEAFDKALLKPAAKGYRAVVPQPVRGGVTNFFGNFRDVTSAINNLLQLKVPRAAGDAGRVAVNSTVGILGFFDVASRLGLEKHDEDFGQTLGRWGVPAGPYLVLPLLGPSTLRDAPALAADAQTDLRVQLDITEDERTALALVFVVDKRASVLSADATLEAAFDRYAFIRNAWLQRREYQVLDGDVPEPPPEDLEDPGEPEPPEQPADQPVPASASSPSTSPMRASVRSASGAWR